MHTTYDMHSYATPAIAAGSFYADNFTSSYYLSLGLLESEDSYKQRWVSGTQR